MSARARQPAGAELGERGEILIALGHGAGFGNAGQELGHMRRHPLHQPRAYQHEKCESGHRDLPQAARLMPLISWYTRGITGIYRIAADIALHSSNLPELMSDEKAD
jgi:hypothetical protein